MWVKVLAAYLTITVAKSPFAANSLNENRIVHGADTLSQANDLVR